MCRAEPCYLRLPLSLCANTLIAATKSAATVSFGAVAGGTSSNAALANFPATREAAFSAAFACASDGTAAKPPTPAVSGVSWAIATAASPTATIC